MLVLIGTYLVKCNWVVTRWQ